jgi:hypothetical protein
MLGQSNSSCATGYWSRLREAKHLRPVHQQFPMRGPASDDLFPKPKVFMTFWLHLHFREFLGSIVRGDCAFQQRVDLTEMEGYLTVQIRKQVAVAGSWLFQATKLLLFETLSSRLAFLRLEPFFEIAGFTVLYSFCVPFVETFVFGKSSALRLSPQAFADGPERPSPAGRDQLAKIPELLLRRTLR